MKLIAEMIKKMSVANLLDFYKKNQKEDLENEEDEDEVENSDSEDDVENEDDDSDLENEDEDEVENSDEEEDDEIGNSDDEDESDLENEDEEEEPKKNMKKNSKKKVRKILKKVVLTRKQKLANAKKAARDAAETYAKLSNAHNEPIEVESSVDLGEDKVARGKSNYGS